MKRLLLATALLVAVSAGLTAWAASEREETPFAFKNHMHQIYYNYAHAWISLGMEKFDVSSIHLNRMESFIIHLPNILPEYNMDGTPFDKGKFMGRLGELSDKIASMRAAVKKKDVNEGKRAFGDIFRTCNTCHEETKMKYLYPVKRSVKPTFQDYMHRINDNFDYLRLFIEDGVPGYEYAEDHLKLIGYYLELLEPTFPKSGPSITILDRAAVAARIRELRELSGDMLGSVMKKEQFDLEVFRKSLNTLCLACHHEMERID